MEVGRSVFAVA